MSMGWSRRAPAFVLAATCVAAYLMGFAGQGLRADFSHDDLMNLHGAWRVPFSEQVRDMVLFFRPTPTYRPAGSIFYRLLFEGWYFNALPYRLACYGLLLLNLGMAYALVRRLAGSRLTAGIAVLLFAYHGGFAGLYCNTGLCYDLLCFFFYTAAFLYYVRVRQRGSPLGWKQVTAWSGLYLLALNSKEIAVSLPVLMGVYELTASPPAAWKLRDLSRWVYREGRAVVAGGIITVLYIGGRVMAPAGLAVVDAYRPDMSAGVYLEHAYNFLRYSFYEPAWLTPAAAAGIATALVVFSLRSSLPFRVGAAWMFVGILPIAFIFQRDLAGAYLPSFGLALWLAAALAAISKLLKVRPAAMFAGVLLILIGLHARHGRIDYENGLADARYIRSIYDQLRQSGPLPKNGRVLILRQPFPDAEWDFTFLIYLHARDRGLEVWRRDVLLKERPASQVLSFDTVFSYENGRLVRCEAAPFERVSIGDLAGRSCIQTSFSSLSVIHSSLYESRILRRSRNDSGRGVQPGPTRGGAGADPRVPLRNLRDRSAHLPWQDGPPRAHAASVRTRDVGSAGGGRRRS
jgi:hypothetical protein